MISLLALICLYHRSSDKPMIHTNCKQLFTINQDNLKSDKLLSISTRIKVDASITENVYL